ncbi:hypothetical protein EC973_008239 [Apophysomyces ossiformis]|uniref:Uncharacterized protein n=1 Tax=Apophysomyces ossiformis TaxID=679940 RepID=A0A8H7BI64_9FUNG|nr:hypothetical protein EC973_008239 [Apophysomyces ossiformis]
MIRAEVSDIIRAAIEEVLQRREESGHILLSSQQSFDRSQGSSDHPRVDPIVYSNVPPSRSILNDAWENSELKECYLPESMPEATKLWLEGKDMKRVSKNSVNPQQPPPVLQDLYTALGRKANVVVEQLKKTCRFSSQQKPRSQVPIDKRKLAYMTMEQQGLQMGVPLDLCEGRWGANFLITHRWENGYNRRNKKSVETNGVKSNVAE